MWKLDQVLPNWSLNQNKTKDVSSVGPWVLLSSFFKQPPQLMKVHLRESQEMFSVEVIFLKVLLV